MPVKRCIKTIGTKCIGWLLTFTVAGGFMGGFSVFAEKTESSSLNESIFITGGRENIYANYLKRYADAPKPTSNIIIPASEYTSTARDPATKELPKIRVEEYEGLSDCLVWTNHGGDVTYSFEVAKEGLYHLELRYFPISGENTVIETGLLIDGEYPFTAAKTFTLDRYWKDESVIKKDSRDNDIRPGQVAYDIWVTYPIKDREGLFNEPYYFYLTKGKHTLTLRGIKMNIALKSLTFTNYASPPSYADIKPTQEQIQATNPLTTTNEIGSNTVLIQAESPLYKTSSTLYATYDRTSYLTSPSHPTKQRYNTIGAGTWNKSTQALTYEFSVPYDGYYRFSFKVRQNTMRGFFSNRRIYIDGKVPVKEFEIQKFKYDPNWYQQSLVDENGEEIYLFLSAGKHTITIEAVPGEIGEVMQRLDELVYQLNYYYRRILMITGPSPDEYKDYFVDKQIPELLPAFESMIQQLYAEKEGLERLSGKGSEAAALQTLAIILQRCVDEPDLIPRMGNTLKESISSVSAWMRDYRDQPLEMDFIEIATDKESFSETKGNFFDDIAFGFKAFIGSFFEDYTKLSDVNAKTLNVWVALGRDQTVAVKQLVDSDFNMNSNGVQVSINLVQGAILEATLADKGPEVALFIGGDFPIQLAARGLLVDLKQFKDYDEVSKRFTSEVSTLFSYNGGVYGLPLTQQFPMMFYRSDILEELGIKPPETWDEFIQAIPVLQRKYLKVGLLSPALTVSSNIFEVGDTFAMLMLQTGQPFYRDNFTSTTFDTPESLQAFTTWTKFYTVYDFEQTYDAFSRFRTGEMPIVIQPYTFYNQLSVAAPEIKGLWDFTLVPGTVQPDGSISHAANSSGSCALIFSKVTDTQAAWTFIKWFTSTKTQVQFGRSIEALLGPMGRYDTANLEAMKQLPWSSAEYAKISAQMAQTKEIPIIPASYAVTRHIKNAFRAVVNEHYYPRYALSSYNRDINYEIQRKNEELSSFR